MKEQDNSNKLQHASELMIAALLRDLGEEVDLILQFGSHLKGNRHKYSDLDLCYIPVHEQTWHHFTVLVQDTLIDLFPIHWSQWQHLADFGHVNSTILIDNQILYHRSEEALGRFKNLQAGFQALFQPEARPQMVRKAQKIFQDTGYPNYLLSHYARKGHTLAALQHAQTILQTIFHCLAVLNQSSIDTRKRDQLLALPLLPMQFGQNLQAFFAASQPGEILRTIEALMDSTRDLLLSEQQLVLRQETGYPAVFKGAYPELKNDLQHVMLACEQEDQFNFKFMSLIHELMVHMAHAQTGIAYSDFNSIAEYEQDLVSLGFPDLLPLVLAGDYAALHEACQAFDRRLQTFLSEHGVALNNFSSIDELRRFLQDPAL